jgi:hypothetical protein
MTARRRRAQGVRVGPSPELIATVAAAVMYGGALLFGTTILAGSPQPTSPVATDPPGLASPTPAASIDPLRADIGAILQVDGRLIEHRDALREILARTPVRGSDVAFELRKIKPDLLAGAQRAGRLAQSSAAREVGAQLELLYASAIATIDRAADLSLSSDQGYRDAGRDIVVLFTDLPAIDRRLQALLEPVASASVAPSPPASARPSSAPSWAPPPASPSPAPTASLAAPSTAPTELLRDGGFERGIGAWTLRVAGSTPPPTVDSGSPLGPSGTRSLQILFSAGGTPSTSVGVGQGPLAIKAGSSYVARVSLRSSVPASVQLRVVGPAEETYGIRVVEVGPQVTVGELLFDAIIDDPAATFWIDIAPSAAGTVALDDASLAPTPAG